MLQSQDIVIQQTTRWIQEFVIELNLCPFARREMSRGSAKFQVSMATSNPDCLADLAAALECLNTHPEIETTLLIFPSCLHDFFDYLDFVEEAEACLCNAGFEGIFQMATFHPQYCFADAAFDDVSNYTNRSPYPMLHLLREDRMEKAIAAYGNTEQIPENNIKRLQALGIDKVKQITGLI